MRALVGVMIAVAIAACGADTENSNGPAVPHQFPGETYQGERTTLGGTVRLAENGCWNVDDGTMTRLVVWPQGADLHSNGMAVTIPASDPIPSGAVVAGWGTLVAISELPGGPDGYWATTTGFCATGASDVLVFDDVETLTDRTQPPDLTVAYGCGYGFTLASADQRFALLLQPTQPELPVTGDVSFPSEQWTGVLRVGVDLMVNWCDDVVEPHEPIPFVAAQWPVVAGSLSFDPPSEVSIGCGIGARTADVSGLEVDTGTGDTIRLDVTSIVNDAYGCFAG